MPDYRFPISIRATIQLATANRGAVQDSRQCGCYGCGAIFCATDVTTWTDAIRKQHPVTALCPRCGVDAVLPDASIEVTAELLELLRRYWITPNTKGDTP